MIKIFWVEDQQHWIDKFRPLFERSHFALEAEGDLPEGQNNTLEVFRQVEPALARIAQTDMEHAPDIAILDANLNGDDEGGFSLSRALLKKWPTLPIIFLSEHSGTHIERQAFVEGMTQDFIAKHQRNIEGVLQWRIKALLRHHLGPQTSQHLTSGELSIDLVSWEVRYAGKLLMNPANPKRPLAPTPRKILRFLVEASPRALTTLQMADKLEADYEKFSYDSYRQHIRVLRQSMAQAYGDVDEFMNLCKAGEFIATFGDQGAYLWKPRN